MENPGVGGDAPRSTVCEMTSRIVPHAGPVGGEQDASSSKSGALRAAIFGMNDGLVSNLSLIFGVAEIGVGLLCAG